MTVMEWFSARGIAARDDQGEDRGGCDQGWMRSRSEPTAMDVVSGKDG